eukprot:3074604-Prorocentrum_lima.AAC.1
MESTSRRVSPHAHPPTDRPSRGLNRAVAGAPATGLRVHASAPPTRVIPFPVVDSPSRKLNRA